MLTTCKWLGLRWHPWAYWKACLAKQYENKCSMWFDKDLRTKLKSKNQIVMSHNVWVSKATVTRFVGIEVFWLPWVFKSQNDGLMNSWGVAKHMCNTSRRPQINMHDSKESPSCYVCPRIRCLWPTRQCPYHNVLVLSKFLPVACLTRWNHERR